MLWVRVILGVYVGRDGSSHGEIVKVSRYCKRCRIKRLYEQKGSAYRAMRQGLLKRKGMCSRPFAPLENQRQG